MLKKSHKMSKKISKFQFRKGSFYVPCSQMVLITGRLQVNFVRSGGTKLWSA